MHLGDLSNVVQRATTCAKATKDWSEEQVIEILNDLLSHFFDSSDTTEIETGRIRLHREVFSDGSGWCIDAYYNLGAIYSHRPGEKRDA